MTEDGAIKKHREIKSYVLRQGRLTIAQQNALDNYWQDYGIDYAEKPLSLEKVFKDQQPTIVEIGFGNGDSLLQQAIAHPKINFIGIEVHGPGVGHLIHFAHKAELTNLKVIRHDAVEVLKHQLADHSIRQLQLFFPDPWHKKKHNKRRILNPSFIELVNKKLLPGGYFHLATDWQPYAEQMLEQLDDATGFSNTAGRGHYSSHRGERSETKFERRGINLGHGVWDLIYQKQ